jgi:predicted aminopeptidase
MREKLETVLRARAFARQTLGFEIGESYATLAEVDADAVAYVVTAAHRDRLESYTWRYPIVGRMPYRGFFDRGRAEAYAGRLGRQDLDAMVWPTVAFSTLGWFADPVLSSMLADDVVGLATVVFHELTHVHLFVPGAAAFNESFANFVGHRAAIVFFCAPDQEGPAGRCALAEDRWRDERAYGAVLEAVAEELRVLYATGPPPDVRATRREAIMRGGTERLTREALRTTRYRGQDLTRFNNAAILHQLLYRRELRAFEAVWSAQGADLGRTVAGITAAARTAADPFAAMAPLASPGAQHAPGAAGAMHRQHAAATASSTPAKK